MLRKKYMSNAEYKRRNKKLAGYTFKQVKEIAINSLELEVASFKYILERDNYNCRLCGSKENLEVHHITPRSLGGTNHELNLITTCKNCHGFLHLNPFGRMKRSEMVKSMLVKINGNTFSKKGNKWGRREIPEKAKLKVIELSKSMSIRDIAKRVYYWDGNNNKRFIGKSTVHKIISENDKNKK